MQQYFSDAEQLVNVLRDRFAADKIYVAGHSWGTVIGTHLAQAHPEQIQAYIGVGQVVDLFAGMDVTYEWALDTAKRTGNQDAVKELEAQGKPVAAGPAVLNQKWSGLMKWIAAFGGSEYHASESKRLLQIVQNPEYSLSDWKKFSSGTNVTADSKVMTDVWGVHLEQQIPEYRVPVYFLQGKHDYHTPYTLVERYYAQLKAPKKKLIAFEDSAHDPFLEETDAFNKAMIETVLAETLPGAR